MDVARESDALPLRHPERLALGEDDRVGLAAAEAAAVEAVGGRLLALVHAEGVAASGTWEKRQIGNIR